MSAMEVHHVSGGSRGEIRVLTYCQAKSMSTLGTKGEPGSEVTRDKNLLHGERAREGGDMGALVPLVSEKAVIRDPLIFSRANEFAAQPPQFVQLIGERYLSQNGSDEVDGEGFLVGICAHDLLDSEGRQIWLGSGDGTLVSSKPRTWRAVGTDPGS